jgi:hypothetical protein
MKPLLDTRCPQCNVPTVGDEDVLLEVPNDLPAACPGCHVRLRIVLPPKELAPGEIPTAFFDTI